MYITSRTLQTIAWSTLAVSTARAQYIIDNHSFGHKDGVYISPDLRSIPHFDVVGVDDYKPQVLSDRVILTPPYPGSKRGALWSTSPMGHSGDWTAELDFRATGMERGGGNLQLWYTKESQAHDKPSSLYTAPKFDGLVLVVDQYEGHGGSVRGFLNDGTKDFKSHPDPDQLAFGKCDHAYRNRGHLSTIKLHHAEGFLEVIVDGESCFKTDKVRPLTHFSRYMLINSPRSSSPRTTTSASAPPPLRTPTPSKSTNSSSAPQTATPAKSPSANASPTPATSNTKTSNPCRTNRTKNPPSRPTHSKTRRPRKWPRASQFHHGSKTSWPAT